MTLITNISNNLAILPVLIPLLAGPLSFLCARYSWIIAVIAILGSTFTSIILALKVVSHGYIAFQVGGWAAPYGIEFIINRYNSIFLLLGGGVSSVIILYCYSAIEDLPKAAHNLFYSLLLFSYAGFVGVISTNDLFNYYVFFEIGAISAYGLITASGTKESYVTAFEYLIISSVAAIFTLLGIGLLYIQTGTLNLNDLSAQIALLPSSSIIKLGGVFLSSGLLLKSAIFPFHCWINKLYSHTNGALAAFFSATSSNLGLIILIKIIFIKLKLVFPELLKLWLIIATISMMICSILAIDQKNIKTAMAYSSCIQFSYILLAVSLGDPKALHIATLLMVSHLLAKSSIFLIIGLMPDFQEKIHASRFVLGLLVLNLLFLIGIPPTISFMAKWQLLSLLVHKQLWIPMGVFSITILCSFLYCGKFIELIHMSTPGSIRYESKFLIFMAGLITAANIIVNISYMILYTN